MSFPIYHTLVAITTRTNLDPYISQQMVYITWHEQITVQRSEVEKQKVNNPFIMRKVCCYIQRQQNVNER